jgi:hypothetical protein
MEGRAAAGARVVGVEFGRAAATPVAPVFPAAVVVVVEARTVVVVVGRGRVVVVVLEVVVVVDGGLIVSTQRKSLPHADSRTKATTTGTRRRRVTAGRR